MSKAEPGIDYSKLYEILAMIQYNSERLKPLEDVLRKFLISKEEELEVASEVRKGYAKSRKELTTESKSFQKTGIVSKSYWFRQKTLLLTNIPAQYVPEYIVAKYFPFSEDFKAKYHLRVEALLYFTNGVMNYLNFKKNNLMFNDEIYQFSSKKEYADLGFVARPTEDYIDVWKNISTLSLTEVERILSGILSPWEVKKSLEMLLLDLQEQKLKSDNIDFAFTPFLRLDEDTFVLMVESYLMRSLPSIYESLLKKVKVYRDIKGKTYEQFVQETLKSLPFTGLTFNVPYGGQFEVDAVCEFSDSIWFIEVTSHPPSLEALKGDPVKIEDDLDKALNKCLKQGERCISQLKTDDLRYWGRKNKIKGVCIVVDGVYPQLNMNTSIKFFDTETRTYLINWFDLRTLLEQPEFLRFEEFLLWRTQQPMPIVSFDEKDYWGYYFDRYATSDPKIRDGYQLMKEKDLKLIYISHRFTDKRYLGEVEKSSKRS